MHTVGAYRPRQCGVVINEESGAVLGGHLSEFHTDFISLAGGQVLIAKLDCIHTSVQSRLNAGKQTMRLALVAVGNEVQTKVNLWQ